MPETFNDLSDLSDDQLDSALNGAPVDEAGDLTGDLTFGSEEEAEEKDAESEDEAPADEGDADAESGDPDAEGDAEEEKADDAESDEAEEDGDDDALPASTRAAMEQVLQRLELMEAERDKISAQLEREMLLRDRNAGRLGALMQKLDAKKSATRETGDDFDSESEQEAEPERQTSKKSEAAEALDEIRQEKVSRAVTNAATEFYTENQTFFSGLEEQLGQEAAAKFQQDLVERIQAHQKDVGEDLYSMSPKMAAKVSQTLIRSAFADMKLSLLREAQQAASASSEESRRQVRGRKKGASGVRSQKRAAAPSTKTKSLSEMSDAELDAALKQAAGLLE
jgi:hypothetical protein